MTKEALLSRGSQGAYWLLFNFFVMLFVILTFIQSYSDPS